MATEPQVQAQATAQAYVLEGTIVEACSCDVLCPCWVGSDPDGGTCDGVLAYNIEQGQIKGVDVSGLTVLGVAHIPGNIFAGGARMVFYIDDRAAPQQVQVLSDCFMGKLGGPLQDLIGTLVGETGEIIAVEQAPIEYELVEGEGRLRAGDRVDASTVPFKSPYGTITTLRDSVFSTIPGSPAWVGRASSIRVNVPEHGLQWTLEGTNAIQGQFHFEA